MEQDGIKGRKGRVEMLKYEEFESIWKKKRNSQDVNTPSPEVWRDITKVFKTCDELYHKNKVYMEMLEKLLQVMDGFDYRANNKFTMSDCISVETDAKALLKSGEVEG
jgi:hypothetical protein